MAASSDATKNDAGISTSKDVSAAIESAKSLVSKKLDLSRRLIKEIPAELNCLQKLEYLYLERNELQYLPDNLFTSLPHLKWLDLRNNKLKEIPANIGESRFLRSLLLENNQLQHLPLELGLVQTLSGLHLAGNPLEFPSENIIEQGTQVIISFLRDLLLQKQQDEGSSLSEKIWTWQNESSTESESRKLSGEERAQQVATHSVTPSPPLSLPPINDRIGLINSKIDHINTNDDGSISSKSANESLDEIAPVRKERGTGAPQKKGRKKGNVKVLEFMSKETAVQDASRKNEILDRNDAKSPQKVKRKNKRKEKPSKENLSTKVIMKAKVKESGLVKLNYEGKMMLEEKTATTKFEKKDANDQIKMLENRVDEEKYEIEGSKGKVPLAASSGSEKARKEGDALNIDELSIGDMVLIKVAEKHFIPGQPCLGKIVSLPDASGVLLVHYYTGSYGGEWRPMMSRSSPYLRRVPLSNVLYKFILDETSRISQETITRIKDILERSAI